MQNNYIKDHKEFIIELREMQLRYEREDENTDFYEDENDMIIINYEEESN